MHRPLIFAAALAFAQPALAQAQAPAPAQAAVSPRSEALVRRLMKALDMEKQMDALLTATLPGFAARMNSGAQLSEAEKTLVLDTALETMREVVTPRLVEAVIPLYAEHYTEAELAAMVTFYESPVGASIMAKTPAMAPKVAAATQALMPAAMEEMLTRLCTKLDCAPSGIKPRRS
ncbi:DUF2059 domain-containing protein [Phenylobacterium sp.]|jgi:hypothetical protein|uniref:DUF2059 domain-containing protein n=1 Tax=Phenylobacterium sp. TaxID=1871053 RepID=UPI0037835F9A